MALLLVIILGAALSLALFFILRGWERKSSQDELDNLAQERLEILQNRMLGSLEVLHSVAAFYSANEHFSRVDFDKFVADARVRHPELQGLSWDPLVTDAQREDYEAAAHRDGFTDFKFSELNADGRMVAATHREEYVPVYYEQPFEKNEAALGFDLASSPQRKSALDQARDTGLPVATVPIRLVQETENQMGFLVVMPIFRGEAGTLEQRRQNLAGFGSAVFRIGDLVESSWKNLVRNDVSVTILDRANGNEVIYSAGKPGANSDGLVSRQTLAVAGMTWDVFFRPAAGYAAAGSPRQSWAALAAGLMITTLIAAYISRGLRRTAEIEQRVAERTAELSNEVSERQRVEDVLRATEKKYREIFENSIEGIFQTTLDGRYISANPALARIYGYESPVQLMADLVDIGGRLYVDPRRREEFMRLVHEKGSVSDFESQVRRRDGRVIWISEKARAVRDGRGAILYYEGAVEDVTGRKQVATTLQKAHDELEVRVAERTAELAKSNAALQAEIVERKRAEDAAEMASRAKSTFLAHMSHEIRTPLNAILGYAQILQRNQNLAPEQRRAVETIATSGNHLFGLIDDVLDISKIEAGRMELQNANFDLHSLVRRLESMFQHRCQQKGIRLRIESSVAQASWVHGDEGKLRQVLINLLGNAVKFTGTGEVTLRIDPQPEGVHRFEVRDTGIGIPAEEQANVLQPFRQGARGTHQGGAGLGLAITRQCVDLMGGRLWFTSEEGKGSSFCFTVPLPEAGGVTPDHEQNFLQLAPGCRVLALVVDDIRENREVLASILRAIGCEVATAENGAQAVELARESRPDIVFMDIWMPGMNGIETTQRILSGHGDRIKMVAHSASAFDHEQRRYLDAGFDDFFAKPFRCERLCECLKNLLGVEFEPLPSPGAVEAGAPPEPGDFTFPGEMAARVRAAAELYSTTEIRGCLAEIARADAGGRRVAEHLQRMADRYDMAAILEFLDKSRAALPLSQS
ncbi:MAG TPA: CHASE domain-containing protein [Chthoniobacteraceae bacterium]|nr:CHASE domain-containing protein [Chthoniobacteraceae bacterium]